MMLHFIRPHWLWMLLPALCYLVWVIYSKRQYNPWKKVCDPHLLQALLQSSSYRTRSVFYFSLFLFYTICIFSLAGPALKKASLPLYREVNSLMLVLDLSSAMDDVDLKPDRLTRAKYKIRDLINASQNMQMGLVVFSQEAFIVSPLSQDANTLDALLDELSPEIVPVSGSDSGQGLTEGYRLLQQAAESQGNVLLITASLPTANSFSTAQTISQNGGHVSVLAILDNNTTNQPTVTQLRQLAKIGGGSFYLFTNDAQDIHAIVNSVKNKKVIHNNIVENAYVWLDVGPWLCLLLIPIALIVLREAMRE